MSEETEPEPQQPLLRVITPDATDEEIAALVAVVSAMAAAGDGAEPAPEPVWSAPARMHRPAYPSGPGAWRASGLPR